MLKVIDELYREEFWKRVEISENCWEWKGHVRPDGYGSYTGIVYQGRRIQKSPNISYLMAFGELPKGLYVCHRCDNKLCVNPNHLFLGTARDNVLDMVQKGRRAGGKRHLLTPNQQETIRKDGRDNAQIAREYRVSISTIWKVKNVSKS